MKRLSTPFYLLLALLALLAVFTAAAQTKIKEVPVHQPDTIDGKALYHEYCAVCHGVDGEGHGPAAAAFKNAPTDLTQLARRNNGKYPGLEVENTIVGGGVFLVHGTKDMRVWGSIFSDAGNQQPNGKMRVYALVKYIEQMQAR
ncbi:MAG: c-type cytochrome [Bryobacteraceae bacterium]